MRFCILPNIEEKVKKHIKTGNISTRWINLYVKETNKIKNYIRNKRIAI